ncbi:MAG: VWA domain-containing protein [Muribaculaceae bacterium]|nr:VWA domain-containing protein [Muribaculaceae bacterium]
MRRTIAFTILFLTCVAQLFAVNDRNYIYLFDCTGSMVTNKVWEPAKKFLNKEIERLDKHSRVTVIPFKQTVFAVSTFMRPQFTWGNVDQQLENALNVKQRYTDICRVWDAAQGKLVKERDNYIILLTDGQNGDGENGIKLLCDKLNEWKRNHAGNVYAFYVMLTDEAKSIKSCVGGDGDNLFFIDAGGSIPTFAACAPTAPIPSYRFVGNKTSQVVVVPVSCGGTFKDVEVESDDPNFKVEMVDGVINDGQVKLRITSRHRDVKSLNQSLGVEHYQIHGQLDASDAGLMIVNECCVNIENKNERALSFEMLDEQRPSLGTAHYYPRLLFWPAKDIDTLRFELTPVFSPEAVLASAVAHFDLSQPTKGSQIFVDGEATRHLVVDARNPRPVRVGIVFDPSTADSRYELVLQAVDSKNLDCIQNTRPAHRFTYVMTAAFERDWNPLAHILMWLAIITVLLLLLWFAVLKRTFYPAIRVAQLRITEPYYSQRTIKGARRVVLTNRPCKQSWVNRVFTGRIIYEVNPAWATPVVLESRKHQVKLRPSPAYVLDPPAFALVKQVDYTLRYTAGDDEKHVFTVY